MSDVLGISPSDANKPIRRISALGALFQCELARGSRVGQNSTITIRGASHVLPFVRGAVLRRVVRGVENGSAKTVLGFPGSREAADGQAIPCVLKTAADERRLIDAVGVSERLLRNAEENLVEVEGVLRDLIRRGLLDTCVSGQDREVTRDALKSLSIAYDGWRISSADFSTIACDASAVTTVCSSKLYGRP
jgi:hypothetical protein